MGMVEHGADRHAERCFAVVAAPPVAVRRGVDGATVGTRWRAAPPRPFQVFNAVLLGGKPLENLYDIHCIPSCLGWLIS